MRAFRELDRILRGDATSPAALRRDGLAVPLGPVAAVVVFLAAAYGLCMGVYSVGREVNPDPRQVVADVVKVPALFALTLVVTFPSLYVFGALAGARLSPAAMARLLAAALGVLTAVLAALGPIVAFFSVTTTSYPFVVLLNVAAFTVAGGFGLSFLLQTLGRLTRRPVRTAEAVAPPAGPDAGEGGRVTGPVVPADALEPAGGGPAVTDDDTARTVFRVWLVMFAVVGAQMSWVLRPFIGQPEREFTWFRPRDASFFEAVGRLLRGVVFGG